MISKLFKKAQKRDLLEAEGLETETRGLPTSRRGVASTLTHSLLVADIGCAREWLETAEIRYDQADSNQVGWITGESYPSSLYPKGQ
jgi:hypothetical protein